MFKVWIQQFLAARQQAVAEDQANTAAKRAAAQAVAQQDRQFMVRYLAAPGGEYGQHERVLTTLYKATAHEASACVREWCAAKQEGRVLVQSFVRSGQGPGAPATSADCLTDAVAVDIWSPALPEGSRRPV